MAVCAFILIYFFFNGDVMRPRRRISWVKAIGVNQHLAKNPISTSLARSLHCPTAAFPFGAEERPFGQSSYPVDKLMSDFLGNPRPRPRPQLDQAGTLEMLATLFLVAFVVVLLYIRREIFIPIAIAILVSFVK